MAQCWMNYLNNFGKEFISPCLWWIGYGVNMDSYTFLSKDFSDLNIINIGYEACESSHSYGPAVRDYNLLHYVVSGKGSFFVNGERYDLQSGDAFFIFPDIITYYEADEIEPWHYIWIAFDGEKSNFIAEQGGIGVNTPIYHSRYKEKTHKILFRIKDEIEKNTVSHIRCLGIFLEFFATVHEDNKLMMKAETPKILSTYVDKAILYIRANIWKPISIKELAWNIGIDRTYLWQLFKQEWGISPQQFIIKFKVEYAMNLLENMQLSISDVSRSVGYEDPLSFSRVFKNATGVSPREFRKSY